MNFRTLDPRPARRRGFVVVEVEPQHHLVLESTTNLPLEWRTDRHDAVAMDLDLPAGPGSTTGSQTRFVFRWRARVAPWWVRVFTSLLIVPADVVMSHDMLHGLKRRAEEAGRRPSA